VSALAVTPGLVDAILVAVALEFAALCALLWRAGAQRLVLPLLLYLASGAFLLAALRAAIASPTSEGIAAALLASLLAHAASLAQGYRALRHSLEAS